MKELIQLIIFIGICVIIYLLYKYIKLNREGMTDASGNSTSTVSNGIAGNASSYSATVKATSIQLQDTVLVTKYRTDYETIILNLDDLINNLMLETVLSIDVSSPLTGFAKLNSLNESKQALNNVMKFLDAT